MKKLTTVLAVFLVLALAVPAFAEGEDELSIKLTRLRNRLDYLIQTPDGSSDDTQEFFEDDVDIRILVTKGELSAELQFEAADTTFASDYDNQDSTSNSASSRDVNRWLEMYYFAWKPKALEEKKFQFKVGAWDASVFQTPNGYLWGINSYPPSDSMQGSFRGAFEVTMTLGKADTLLEYRRLLEGDRADDVEGDEHLLRGWSWLPIGESGFSVGVYGAAIIGSDLIFEDAVPATDTDPGSPAVMGDRTAFQGSLAFEGTVSKATIYGETGFASGKEETDVGDADLSGFFFVGGASVPVGKVTLGIEGGYGTGDDDATDNEDSSWMGPSSDYWVPGWMHDMSPNGAVNGGSGGVSNLMFVYGSVSTSLNDKTGLDFWVSYMKPVEKIVSPFTEKEVDTYGIDFAGQFSYKLASNLMYYFNIWYALPNEDFIDGSRYIFRNRLQFAVN
jgi:hypothetical protein